MKDFVCHSCKYSLHDDYCHFGWAGLPFSKTSKQVQLCSYCGYLVVPKVIGGFAIMGTSSNDIFTVKEMKEEGFTDKKRLVQSIRSVGKIMGLTAKQISAKLKG